MNISEYLNNPAGKGDSSIPNKKLIQENLQSRYYKLIKDKKIEYSIYRVNDKNYYIHFIMPSEYNTNNYDVVVQFINNNNYIINNIEEYDIKLFCNAPSFIYTFANVYMENGLYCEILKNKLNKIVFKQKPEIRNKYGLVNYEKHIYFACMHIQKNKSVIKYKIQKSQVKTFNNILFLKKIRSFDKINIEIIKAKKKIVPKNKNDIKDDVGIIKKKDIKKPKSSNVSKVKAIKPKKATKPLTKKIK